MTKARRIGLRLALLGLVGAVLVVLIVVLATRPSSQSTSFQSPLLGRNAPPTAGVTLQGPTFSIASAKGRPVVLNFFASWCPPCQEEAPQLSAFTYDQSKLSDGAKMVGIVFNDSTSAMESFIKAQGVNYPVLTDPRGLLGNEWGVSSPPTTFIISPSGRVVKALVGPTTASQLDKAVAQFQTPSTSSGN